MDNIIDECPRVSQLVWAKDLSLETRTGEVGLVERCERIIQYDKSGVTTIMLFANTESGSRISKYTDNAGIVYKSGDITTHVMAKLKRCVSGNGNVWWKLKEKTK